MRAKAVDREPYRTTRSVFVFFSSRCQACDDSVWWERMWQWWPPGLPLFVPAPGPGPNRLCLQCAPDHEAAEYYANKGQLREPRRVKNPVDDPKEILATFGALDTEAATEEEMTTDELMVVPPSSAELPDGRGPLALDTEGKTSED